LILPAPADEPRILRPENPVRGPDGLHVGLMDGICNAVHRANALLFAMFHALSAADQSAALVWRELVFRIACLTEASAPGRFQTMPSKACLVRPASGALSSFFVLDFAGDVLRVNDERLDKRVAVPGEPTHLRLNFRLGLIQ
jgi:hypothetical protein